MKFALVTPLQEVAQFDHVTYVRLPGTEGDFGVLMGHMPLLATLRENAEIQVTLPNETKQAFTVSGGFVDVSPGCVTVLAERVHTSNA